MSFDNIARHYRWLEAVLAGRVLQRYRTAFMDEAQNAKSALLLGEGNGRFLAPFLQVNSSARVVCVEQSEPMIACAKRTLKGRDIDAERVEFIQQDILHWAPPKQEFDLVVTHFFLDCFTEGQLQALIPRLAAAAQAESTWLLADFQIPPGGLPKLRARAIHKLMYAFFRITTNLPARRLTPPDDLLRGAGFERLDHLTAQWGLIHSDCWRRTASSTRSVFDDEALFFRGERTFQSVLHGRDGT